MSFPAYDTYTDSGEDWLGAIPNHWALLRTKNIFRLVAEPAPKNNDEELLSVYSDIGVRPRRLLEERGNRASTTDGYWIVKKGDVVVNKLLAWMGAIGVSEYEGVTSPAYDILRPFKSVDSRFYHYLFRNPICISKLKQHSKGIMEMRLRLYFDEFGDIKIPYPPPDEQKRIATFLDQKTAEIDEAIAKKQRLIELLQEQKAILINQAVTKGLNPDAPMRDSGVEWIGEIPTHWRISRSKWLFNVRNEFARPDDIQLSATQAYGVISQQEYMNRVGRKVTQITQHLEKRSHVEVDDFVISMRSFQGGLERAWESGCIRSSYVVLEPSPQVNIDFFAYLFKSHSYIQALRATANFIRDGQDLNFNNFSLVDLPVIPLDEQQAIADYLTETAKLSEESVKAIQHEIDLLHEYRAILIANAVTGKIKV